VPTLYIANATVVDATNRAPRTGQGIVVRGGVIVAVGANVVRPSDAEVIDARGRFVIPGLWDMHVHLDMPGGADVLPAYIVSGVTGVRDLAGYWDTLTTWRRQVTAGTRVGPRIYASGPYLEGNPQPIPHIPVKSAADAVRGVDSLRRLGVDVIKFHTGLTRETFFAAARRAREVGMPFAGHVPRVISAIEASDSGMRSLEHLLTIPTPCTAAESLALVPRHVTQRVLGPCSSASLEPLWRTLVKNGTWVTPTYVAAFEIAEWPLRPVPGDAYQQYLPRSLKDYVASIFPMPDSIPADSYRTGRALFEKRVALAGEMQRAGIKLLAGTDAPLRNSPPGFGLAEELAILERGGLTPFDVLKVATWEPANYFGILDRAGSVAPGRNADLVILDRSPLAGAAAYRSVRGVVAAGRYFGRPALDSVLAALRAAAPSR